jgi:hypothetical protein
MSTHFPYGFRIDSLIEISRFRSFAAEDFGHEISITDEKLKKTIASCGIIFDGKVYVISPEKLVRIHREFDAAFVNGAETVFFEAFYDKHQEWLFDSGVVSIDMLRNILKKQYPNFTHRGNYVTSSVYSKSEHTRIEYEIVRVWGDKALSSYSQLAEYLPYIPLEKIKHVLACNDYFIWNSERVYTRASRIDITEEEHSVIADFVAKGCLVNGYVSLRDIPLGEIEERNHELTLTAIHDGVFRICLSDKYDKNGKIITRKGGMFDALSITKDYCRTLDKCSFDDLLRFQEKLVGQRTNQRLSMEAAYSVFVRIDKNTFLAEKYVNFNITEVDNTIELFVTDDYLPIKAFTTFVAFPNCGQAWNLFLLESYCRRFSERFHFDAQFVNSRNAGAVIRKSCGLTYVEVMADAVAKSGVIYEEKAIGKFLCENGYTGRRTTARAAEIIEKAKAIRERMD